MSATNHVVDFYVEPVPHEAGTARNWGVYRESLSQCVGIDDNPEEATAHATRMARYLVSRGDVAQIHVREDADAPWCTVWCPPDMARRFPALPVRRG